MKTGKGLEPRRANETSQAASWHRDLKRDPAAQLRSNRALQQAAKMEAIQVLAGGIAHDFNNRLTVILGNLELLEAEVGDSEESLSLIRDARLAAENGSGLARQLLAIARPQTEERELNDVNAVISRLENLLGHAVGKSASLHLSLKADLPRVVFDSSGLEDVLVNLAINARDAMSPGDRLTIETDTVWLNEGQLLDKPDLSPGKYAVIACTDTGHGMSAAVRERAFEPYYSTKGDAGTGLGLSMVYSFARRWRGYVCLDSEPGHGTCVTIYIPVDDGPSDASGPARRAAARPASSFPGRKIVVVEEQAQIRDIAAELLHDMGCEVHSFSDADEALKYIEAGPDVDLLFTDIVPGGSLDGVGLAAVAKRVRPAMQVIFTSGYTRPGPFAGRFPAIKPWSRRSIEAAMTAAFSRETGSNRADDGGAGEPAMAMAG